MSKPKQRVRHIKFTRESVIRVGLGHVQFYCNTHKIQRIAQLERECIVLACGCRVPFPKGGQ